MLFVMTLKRRSIHPLCGGSSSRPSYDQHTRDTHTCSRERSKTVHTSLPPRSASVGEASDVVQGLCPGPISLVTDCLPRPPRRLLRPSNRPVNERLETLGDAWLNYYAGFVVFQVGRRCRCDPLPPPPPAHGATLGRAAPLFAIRNERCKPQVEER